MFFLDDKYFAYTREVHRDCFMRHKRLQIELILQKDFNDD